MLEALATQRRTGERALWWLDPVDRIERTCRLEQREPNVLSPLESDRHLLADPNVGWLTPDDVGREVDSGVLRQRDVGNDVRGVEVGEPAVLVHGATHHRAAARHRRGLG
jgi:hypothetical protein